MTPLPRLLQRLARRSPRELAGRGLQVVRARLESVGLGEGPSAAPEDLLRALGDVASFEDLLEGFRMRAQEGPLPAFRDPARTVEILKARWPGLPASTARRADRIAAGRFDLLGYRDASFGDPIDWHLDPIHGLRSPRIHWSRVPYLDPAVVGDHKIVWELNRHQYLVTLGQAAWLDDDPRWDEVFAHHLTEWMRANPPKIGINWTSSLELAFRCASWLWALHFFSRSESLAPTFFARAVAFLRAQGRHVERYISTYFSPNTHLTGEALGLVYLGTMLPELPEAERWRRRGERWLMDALEFQIRPDGGYFEQSTHYHRYTVDFYVHLLLLTRARRGGPPAGLEEQLARMTDHLVAIMRPDGHAPTIGDDDAGRFLFLDGRPAADVRSTVLTAAVLLGRADWARVVGAPTAELVWLLGPDGLTDLERLHGAAPASASRALGDTGLYVMRSGWGPDADYSVVRCGPHGALSGGHAHADALSIEVSMAGEPILVDPGTGSYSEPELRDWFRSTPAHCSVSVGGRSSSEPGGPFAWQSRAGSYLCAWASHAAFDYFEGWHDGFERLAPGLRHQRAVLYVRGGYWVIRDRIYGAGSASGSVTAHFQFAAGLRTRALDASRLEVANGEGRSLALLTSLSGQAWEHTGGRVSPSYGAIRDAPAWDLRVGPPTDSEDPAEVVTLIAPTGHRVRPLVAEGGAAWAIGEAGDVLVVGNTGVVRVSSSEGRIEAACELLWARPGGTGEAPQLFLVGRHELRLGGRLLLDPSDGEGVAWIGERSQRPDEPHVSRSAGDGAGGDGAGGADAVWTDAEARDAFSAWLSGV